MEKINQLNTQNSALTVPKPSRTAEAEPADFVADFTEWLGFANSRRQRDFNSAEAQKQRDWEEYMSSTAYQRAVQDMKKAGINPIMAFQQGGASSPSGSNASSGSGNGEGAKLIGQIITSAIKLILTKKL